MPLANTGQFFTDEELTSTDLQNAVSLLATSFNDLVTRTMYNTSFVIINGLSVSQSSPADNGVQVASGLAFQNGSTVLLSAQQGVNILPGSYANGTGLAADATYSRIDVVYIQYAQTQANQQTRTFNPPGQSSYTNSVYTELTDGFTLSVVHGTASASPVAPSAPSGSVVLAQVTVPANATTISTSDISDQTSSYRNDGGRLALATNSLLTYKSGTELGTPSGMKLGIGSTAYLIDNTTANTLDIYGGSNGVSHKSTNTFTQSGTPIILQPTADAGAGTHVLSLKNAAGTEYGWIDNGGSSNLNAAKLGGIAAANFIRGDSGAGTQTQENQMTFNDTAIFESPSSGTSTPAIQATSPDGSYIAVLPSGTGYNGLVQTGDQVIVFNSKASASNTSYMAIVPWSGTTSGIRLGSDGSVATANGGLGSASGTWTPASGSLNASAGTVINISNVPTGAKTFFAAPIGGTIEAYSTQWGVVTASGVAWGCLTTTTGNNYANGGHTNSLSSATIVGNASTYCDGTYAASGYFQINNGYLQFVITTTGYASSDSGNTVAWAVS